jgi:hypothetical protein
MFILQVNRHSTDNLTSHEATKLLESAQTVELSILRQTSPLSSTGSSPTPTTVSVMSPLPEHMSPSSQVGLL